MMKFSSMDEQQTSTDFNRISEKAQYHGEVYSMDSSPGRCLAMIVTA